MGVRLLLEAIMQAACLLGIRRLSYC